MSNLKLSKIKKIFFDTNTLRHEYLIKKSKQLNKLVLISFLGTLSINTVEAEILYTEDFETNSTQPISRSHPSLHPSGNAPQIVTAEKGITPRGGSYMMKTYLNRFRSKTNYRTEAVPHRYQNFDGEFKKGKDYWLGVSVFIPEDWSMDYGVFRDGKYLGEVAGGIIMQFHDRSYKDKSWRYGLPLVVSHAKQGFRIWNRGDGCGKQRPGQQTRPGCKPGARLPQFNKGDIPMERGQWNDFVMHVKFSPNSDGFLQVWVNGKKELDQKGRNYYSEHTIYPYFKMGLYEANWKLTGWSKGRVYNVNERTLYHDELRIGGSNSFDAEVAP